MPSRGKRGAIIRLAPAVADLEDGLARGFDWNSDIAVVDMFAGAGGLSLGFHGVPEMGVAGAFEVNREAAETHAANIPGSSVITVDVRDIDFYGPFLDERRIRRVDILAGGPPCQGFSRLGRGALRNLALGNSRESGSMDERNYLFREFMRAVREIGPQVVVIENVPDMVLNQSVMNEIRDSFDDLGYACEHRVLSASEFGVPQRRRRLFIIANRHGRAVSWPTPVLGLCTVRDAIGDLPPIAPGSTKEVLPWQAPVDAGLYLREMRHGLLDTESDTIRDHVTRSHCPDDLEAFGYMGEGDRYSAVPKRLRRYRDDIFKDKYHRMIWDKPAWTITAHLAKDGYKYIHPEQNRTLSVREAARLQSFPDGFRFAGSRTSRFRQIGNAVPPKLAQAVARSVRSLVQ